MFAVSKRTLIQALISDWHIPALVALLQDMTHLAGCSAIPEASAIPISSPYRVMGVPGKSMAIMFSPSTKSEDRRDVMRDDKGGVS